MATEEYSVGYDDGFQAGWNAAIDSELQSKPAQKPAVLDGWVLREVFFNNGDPCGHREPSINPQISTPGCICCLQPTEDKR